jgi:hypothetical protein
MAFRLRTSTAVWVAVLALWALPARAQEPQPRDDPYFALKLMLGLGGSTSRGANINVNGATLNGVNGAASDNLRPTFGGGVQYMHPLHRYFALGGVFAIQSWQSRGGDTANASRNLMFDLSVAPQGRLPIGDSVELYLALPLGLSFDFWNEVSVAAAGVSVKADPALGFNLSLLAGARVALSKSVGLLAELGYTMHSFSHDVHVDVPNVISVDAASIDLTLEQLALNFGVFF